MTAFAMIGTGIVILLVANYIVANIGLFTRRQRSDLKVFPHIVIPILGILAFVLAWLTAAGLPVFPFVPDLTPPISYADPIVAVWMVLALGFMLWLYWRHPRRVADVSRVHLDEEPQ